MSNHTDNHADEIEQEVAFIRVDIGVKNEGRQFVGEWIDDPNGMLAEIIRQVCLHNRAETGKLGGFVMAMILDQIRQKAEIVVDRRTA